MSNLFSTSLITIFSTLRNVTLYPNFSLILLKLPLPSSCFDPNLRRRYALHEFFILFSLKSIETNPDSFEVFEILVSRLKRMLLN